MTRAGGRLEGVPALRAGFIPGVALALALFVGGAAAHIAHHLFDPACDTGRTHAGPCASCAALHGATATSKGMTLASPALEARGELVRSATRRAAAPALGPGAPRAPPLA